MMLDNSFSEVGLGPNRVGFYVRVSLVADPVVRIGYPTKNPNAGAAKHR